MVAAVLRKWFKAKPAGAQTRVSITSSSAGLALCAARDGQQLLACESALERALDRHGRILAQWVSEAGLAGAPTNAVLHPSEYQIVLVEAPPVPPEEYKEALKFRLRDVISLPPADVQFDIFPLPEDAFRGRTRMLYLVATSQSITQRLEQLCQEAGLVLSSVDIAEMALRNVLIKAHQEDANVGILQLGFGEGIINLGQAQNIYLTRRIGVQFSENDFDQLAPGEPMPYAIADKLDALVLEIQRSLDYYESQLGKGVVRKLVLAPTPFDLDVIETTLKSNLRVDLTRCDINQLLDTQEIISPRQQAFCLHALGGCLRQEEN
ncbi:MAG TPA: MSHA biogenesis protein MshI [Pseudomonadales bacterium]|nr:MSHA biogenesis protein MshI [Pseudomonadales bacterium]